MKPISRKIGSALATLVFVFTISLGVTQRLRADGDVTLSGVMEMLMIPEKWEDISDKCSIAAGNTCTDIQKCPPAKHAGDGWDKDKLYVHKCERTVAQRPVRQYCQCQATKEEYVPPKTGTTVTGRAPIIP